MRITRRQARKTAKRFRHHMYLHGTYLETETISEGDPKRITGAYLRRHLNTAATPETTDTDETPLGQIWE